MAQPIPQALSQLLAVNVEYGVLICIGNTCHCAVISAGLTAHVRRKHKLPEKVWERSSNMSKSAHLRSTVMLASNCQLIG